MDPHANPGSRFAHSPSMPEAAVATAPKHASKKRARKNGAAVVVVVSLLGAAGIFFWAVGQRNGSAAPDAPETTLPLETFVVNLNGASAGGSSSRAYLRVGITLGLGRPLPHNQAEAAPTALVRDTILSVLATAQPDELLKPEGKRQLKEELLQALQQRAPKLAVQNVYFTELLVQM